MSGNWPYDHMLHLGHAVARGDLANATRWCLRGYNPNVGGAWEPIWFHTGAYTYPAAGGIQMQVTSNNIQDDVAGNNARTVMIVYLDANYAMQIEEVNLNGGGARTSSATDILRVNGFFVNTTAGFNIAAAANIQLEDVGGAGNVYAEIEGGDTCGCQAIYTVPAGHVLFYNGMDLGVGNTNNRVFVEFAFRTNYCCLTGTLGDPMLNYHRCSMTDSCMSSNPRLPYWFPPKTEIRVDGRASAAAGTSIANVTAHGWLYEVA